MNLLYDIWAAELVLAGIVICFYLLVMLGVWIADMIDGDEF